MSEMLPLLVLCGYLVCSSIVTVTCSNDAGSGMWSMQYFEKCESEQKLKIDVEQTKINRTHDGWNGHFVFDEPFAEGLSVSVEICQLVDGGYRLMNEISEPELLDFLIKNAEKNVKNALLAVGIDPPEFPIDAGEYELKEFMFDYNELPTTGFYGEYSGKVVVRSGIDKVFCVLAFVEFRE